MLGTSGAALHAVHDLLMLDLDGVVYVGPHPVPGAPPAIDAARRAGARVAFVTNNAARPPSVVAQHLADLGVAAAPADVVTSAQAAARVLRERYGEGAVVWALGADGLRSALGEAGIVPVDGPVPSPHGAPPVAIVTGYGPDVRWRELMDAAVHISAGLPWVATNTDHSLPVPQGRAPGHGVLVRMLGDFTGVRPVVAGKPEGPLLEETVRRVGARRPLMVGDRLDTDIEAATRIGIPSLLVLTGVTGLAELAAAPARLRPTYLSGDLCGLGHEHRTPVRHAGRWVAGAWSAAVERGRLAVQPREGGPAAGATPPAADDWWRAAACAAWTHLDATGEVADLTGVQPPVTASGAGDR